MAYKLGRAVLLMLIDIPDPRYRGGGDPEPAPDDERERRWEPISRPLFLRAAGSTSCFLASPLVAGSWASWVLTVGGVALCAEFVRVSLRDDPPRRGRPRAEGDQGE